VLAACFCGRLYVLASNQGFEKSQCKRFLGSFGTACCILCCVKPVVVSFATVGLHLSHSNLGQRPGNMQLCGAAGATHSFTAA
jgi:hypothetical protein